MDLPKILGQLHEELAQLNTAIVALEQMAGRGRRRGRPPKWLSDAKRLAKSVIPLEPERHKRGHVKAN